jgi:hypothetical protein
MIVKRVSQATDQGDSRGLLAVHPPSSSTAVDRNGKSKGKGKAATRGDHEEQTRPNPSRRSSPVTRDTNAEASSAGPSRPRSPQKTKMTDDTEVRTADPFEGMSEEEIFKIVTRPAEIEGVVDWGIPAEVDPDQASDTLKVGRYLIYVTSADCVGQGPAVPPTEIRDRPTYQHYSPLIQLFCQSPHLLQTCELT